MHINILYSRVRRRVRGRLLSLLEALQNEQVDKIEEALIAEGMKALVDSYTDKKIPDKAYQAVAKEVVKCLNKINDRLQKRLKS
jgi:signal recognition particle subunit SEC65